VGGNLFVNLRGREPLGIVEPGRDYEAVRQAIAEALSGLRDPETGRQVVKKVHRREEVFDGPYLEQAADLLVEWVDYAYWGRGDYSGQADVFSRRSGNSSRANSPCRAATARREC
jgi:predicted AlkP superfamily phosphohydrolase/phosphomutase